MKKAAKLSVEAAAAIQAVEGLVVPPPVSQRIEKMRAQGLSNDAIRAAIVAGFRSRAAA